ncbi:MAG: TRAM domain-containing protein [Candidatus Aenigmarchaeota archaeon]|nr:TRAM domain-containing protein [Candidatus Aenigmarchaeota archaeon]
MARFERRGFGDRDRSYGPGVDLPKPVNVGEEYDVEISEVGSRGDGIARVKNFVVFVNGAKQGEKLKIKIKDVRNRFAIGEKVGGESEAAEESVAEEKTETETEKTSETETEKASDDEDEDEESEEEEEEKSEA